MRLRVTRFRPIGMWRRYLNVSALLLSLTSLGCGGREPQVLDLSEVFGRSMEELKERFGKPDILIQKSETVATVQWKSVEGTWVFVVMKDGQARYVTYNFKDMEPFDEEEAFRRIGIDLPEEEPEHSWENGAKRWIPFGEYEKLVTNPVTKAVTVGDRRAYGDPETATAQG